MTYQVKLTSQAIGQIEGTVRYIAKILAEPETALKWADALQNEIAGLNFMPSRYPLTEEEPWRTKGIRKMVVKNFLLYYSVDEENMTVWVIAVIYGRRDQVAALSEMLTNEA